MPRGKREMTERSQFPYPAGAGCAAAPVKRPANTPSDVTADCPAVTPRCPAEREEIAELYLLGHLNAVDSFTFQRHCRECRECKEILENLRSFIFALKSTVGLLHRRR